MAGAVVGGAFLSAFLNVFFDRLTSPALVNFLREQKPVGELLQKLKATLSIINSVLNDAEEKQITDPAVEKWLRDLKDAMYDAEDLLDEIATDASRPKFEAESTTRMDQVANFFSKAESTTRMYQVRNFFNFEAESTIRIDQGRNFFCTPCNLFDKVRKPKIEEILNRFERIAQRKDLLGLKEVFGGKPSQKLPTPSLVEESGIYGRDNDKKEIINSLLSQDASGNEIGVIAIVGMGGIGKSTLAQLVYNDDKVKKHFDLKAWVCVWEDLDVLGVTKTISEAVSSLTCEDLNVLQVKLKETLNGKKFLLVLDDVWSENYVEWNYFQNPFRSGAKGSKIIVTTRSERVASMMGAVQIHNLKHLSDEDCWLLIAKHAFGSGNSNAHPNLEEIGREIVKKCKGLPLAALVLGGLLRIKLDAKEWNKILKSNIWDLPNHKGSIFPSLRLSYLYLPPHLKRCFAYCSIFPKDYEFNKEQLVLLWMAEGFLEHPNKNERLEEVGDEYFNDLRSRSFFQRSNDNVDSCFIMHDLINDLAKVVSEEFCCRLEGDDLDKIPEKTRHFSFCRRNYEAYKRFESFRDAKCLRTFLALNFQVLRYATYLLPDRVPHDLLPTLRCLRVLSLSYYRNISELPESIGNLKHLRFLDLSFTAIGRLPISITSLFNLQTLMLSNCSLLIELPVDIERLMNLRYLDISGTLVLEKMPMHMSRLRSLQTLSKFIVGKSDGFKITELREFRHLRGALHIAGLQNVVHASDALEANLKNKEYLDELVLEWSANNEDTRVERDVLDKLQPHANLQKLTIKHYAGATFPDWLGDHSFCNMVKLRLENCKLCSSLPPLGQLPSLKDLSIIRFDFVIKIDSKFYGNASLGSKAFRSLETLEFEDMLLLEKWNICVGDEGGEFPLLRTLCIKNCPNLTEGLPSNLPSLTTLDIIDCKQLASPLPKAPALSSLKLVECEKVMLRSDDELTSHPLLQVPEISIVTCRPQDHLSTSLANQLELQQLSSVEISSVSCISQWKEFPPLLQSLSIAQCKALESLPEGMALINTCLRHLEIRNCNSLRSFPKGGLPAMLKTLEIDNCGELELLPCEGTSTHDYYSSLESLRVWSSCDSLKSCPLGLFPKLNQLLLVECKNLETLWIPDEGLHEDLTSFDTLSIRNCPKFVSFPKGGLPTPNLTELTVYNCENFKWLPGRMNNLQSLRGLSIEECPEVESFPEGGFPSNLISLTVINCDKLTACRVKWDLQMLASLKRFAFGGSEHLDSFPEKGLLPSTLTSLAIARSPKQESLNTKGLQHLTSLEMLNISCCSKFQCLPEEGLSSSLAVLEIDESPLLEQWCRRKKGEYRSKIARISSIVINNKQIL